MKWKLFILLICLSCTDLILQHTTGYHSIQLDGNAWIHIKNGVNEDKDISIMDDAFTLEFWFTGGNSGNSESACLASIIDTGGAIKFGLFKDPLSPNALEVWLDDTRLDPIPLDLGEDLNSGSSFHHLAITSDEDIQIYLDGTKIDGCAELAQTACEDGTDFLDCVWTAAGHCETGGLGVTYLGINIDIGENDLAIGGKVNQELSTLGNFWTGNIDEIRLWSSILSPTVISYHTNNPEKMAESFEEIHITSLTGLWRFQFEAGDTSPIIPDESCSIITQIYTNPPSLCSNVDDAIIYTLGNDVATFSEKHP